MSHFFQLFGQNLIKTPKRGSLLEKLLNLAKWMIFRSFSGNLPLFHRCAERLMKTPKHGSFIEKLQVLEDR